MSGKLSIPACVGFSSSKHCYALRQHQIGSIFQGMPRQIMLGFPCCDVFWWQTMEQGEWSLSVSFNHVIKWDYFSRRQKRLVPQSRIDCSEWNRVLIFSSVSTAVCCRSQNIVEVSKCRLVVFVFMWFFIELIEDHPFK